MRLGEPEPVVVAEPEGHVGALEVFNRRQDVEHGKLDHTLWMVERKSMGNASSTVMTTDEEAFVSKVTHDFDHIHCHFCLGIRGVIGRRRRLE